MGIADGGMLTGANHVHSQSKQQNIQRASLSEWRLHASKKTRHSSWNEWRFILRSVMFGDWPGYVVGKSISAFWQVQYNAAGTGDFIYQSVIGIVAILIVIVGT